MGASYNRDKQCLCQVPVRQSLRKSPSGVNTVDDSHRILLLTGVAGSGKSTIAHTVAGLFDRLKRLGASFCFDHAQQADRGVDVAFPTIARDLADFDPKLKSSLCNAVPGS